MWYVLCNGGSACVPAQRARQFFLLDSRAAWILRGPPVLSSNGLMPGHRRAPRFVGSIGIVSLFADFTYDGGRSVMGAYLATRGSPACALESHGGRVCVERVVRADIVAGERVSAARQKMHSCHAQVRNWATAMHSVCTSSWAKLGALGGPLTVGRRWLGLGVASDLHCC